MKGANPFSATHIFGNRRQSITHTSVALSPRIRLSRVSYFDVPFIISFAFSVIWFGDQKNRVNVNIFIDQTNHKTKIWRIDRILCGYEAATLYHTATHTVYVAFQHNIRIKITWFHAFRVRCCLFAQLIAFHLVFLLDLRRRALVSASCTQT